MAPVIDLHQERAWSPMMRELRELAMAFIRSVTLPSLLQKPWLALAIMWSQIILDGLGCLLLVAALSGLIKKD